jgi:DNA (cytosine-5)-methyltransferase 1
MNELHLFAGAGGGILGSELLGHRTVCAVEIEEYPRKVLLQRQRDGILPWFPIWDDICTFDGTPWRGIVDIVAGGFPCQDISSAGKGAGIEGKRSGLWGQMVRVVREVRPRFVFVENSPMLTSRGLYRVLGDLAEMGYDARWCVLGADDVGAPHRRKRIWILAYPQHSGRAETENNREHTGIQPLCEKKPEKTWPTPTCSWSQGREGGSGAREKFTRHTGSYENTSKMVRQLNPDWVEWLMGWPIGWTRTENINLDWRDWSVDPADTGEVPRVGTNIPDRAKRLKAIGNGQVPAVVATAWHILTEGLEEQQCHLCGDESFV